MGWLPLQAITLLYLLGLVWFHHRHQVATGYVWGALGFTFILLQMAVLLEWDHQLAVIEAQHVRQIVATALNTDLAFVDQKILMVPDTQGWVGLNITLECSTLIELSIFCGASAVLPQAHAQCNVPGPLQWACWLPMC
ncbi:MAG: hypothetical protein HC915_21475 [Anaerolineae bacterium]|nr:hypothetical protein [Anaerolineae bacterium]